MADFGMTSEGPRTFFLNGELDMATVPIMNIAIVDAVARGGPDLDGPHGHDVPGLDRRRAI